MQKKLNKLESVRYYLKINSIFFKWSQMKTVKSKLILLINKLFYYYDIFKWIKTGCTKKEFILKNFIYFVFFILYKYYL